MILEIALAVAVVGGVVEHMRLSKALASAKADTKVAAAGVKAPASVKAEIEQVLNSIRSDESILQLHVYQLLTRVRTELRKVL